jgi:hypothetical protein
MSLQFDSARAQTQTVVPGTPVTSASTDWSEPLIAEPTVALFAPASGYLLAQTRSGLADSTDGGTTWKPIRPPRWDNPLGRIVAVDPIDGQTTYSTGEHLLYKSQNRGLSWTPVLRDSYFPDGRLQGSGLNTVRVAALAVSPANPSVLYATVTGSAPRESVGSGNSSFALVRSTDGGASWTTLLDEPYGGNTCRWSVDLLATHPTDALRMFMARSCRAGSSSGAALNQSFDQGTTWSLPSWAQDQSPITGEDFGYPENLVGGHGSEPARWYVAVNRDSRRGGSTLLRSDDDTRTWQPVLAYRGGGTASRSESPGAWTVRMVGLAYDPEDPDRIFVARIARPPFNILTGVQDPIVTSGVIESQDGGATWNDLGSQQVGAITGLVLSADRQRLYITSEQGVRMMWLRR